MSYINIDTFILSLASTFERKKWCASVCIWFVSCNKMISGSTHFSCVWCRVLPCGWIRFQCCQFFCWWSSRLVLYLGNHGNCCSRWRRTGIGGSKNLSWAHLFGSKVLASILACSVEVSIDPAQLSFSDLEVLGVLLPNLEILKDLLWKFGMRL